VTAYEIAQQLREQNEQVTLIMIESWPPSSYHKRSGPVELLETLRPLWLVAIKLASYVKLMATLPLGDWPDFLRNKVNRAETILDKGIKHTLADGDFQVDHVTRATLQAVASYKVQEYPGALLNVIAANRAMAEGRADTRGVWDTLAQLPSRRTFIPAEDSGQLFVSPHVEVLSELIADYIGK
jgi:thioesterase domain-containing protein